VHKLGLVHAAGGHGASRLAATEVEYVLMLCRSIFDLLQEIVRAIWDTTMHLSGPNGEIDATAKKQQLKKRFSDVALCANEVRPAEDLMNSTGLPLQIAKCYVCHAPMLLKIRRFRDDIVHRGHEVQTIFRGETEFLIRRRLGPFNLDVWRSEEMAENELGPLLPVLGLLIHGTLAACEDFADTLGTYIRFPPPVVPGLTLWMRGYFNEVLIAALRDAGARVAEGRVLVRPEAS
jgi:hypothetical protein